jgi:glycosyltransferase involved in cell wall biosynthesis
MSLPKIMSPVDTLGLIELESMVLQKEPIAIMAVPPRPALPTRIAVVGNYLPRQCGIATFTTDLCDAIHAEYGATELLALPMNDTEDGYSYPARVRFELSEDNLASYRQAADFLNFSNIDLVCLQHEYGIFGGRAGAHILELLRRLNMPFVTTLHTVLRDPDPDQRAVMDEIAILSDRLIVMSQQSADILQETFLVPSDKIDLIPHGIPDLPFTDPNFYKDGFGTEGKDVLLTFGLLSPNKGIENVIKALPSILSKHSNVVYMISGATHPHVLRQEGDKYRQSLKTLAKDLAWKIHDFRNTKGLAMVQIRYLGRFETKSEAFACPNIPQQAVSFFQIFLTGRSSRNSINGRAAQMAEQFC